MQPFIVPTSDQIRAALDTLIDRAERAFDACAPDDRAYWSSQANTFERARDDLAAGARALDSDDAFLVPSSSAIGVYHRVAKHGGFWRCSCKARRFCRHAALVVAIEYALDLAEQGLVGEAESSIPEDTDPDDFSDVGPERAPRLDDPALITSLVQRLSAKRMERQVAV